jgi:hypothetical protein
MGVELINRAGMKGVTVCRKSAIVAGNAPTLFVMGQTVERPGLSCEGGGGAMDRQNGRSRIFGMERRSVPNCGDAAM